MTSLINRARTYVKITEFLARIVRLTSEAILSVFQFETIGTRVTKTATTSQPFKLDGQNRVKRCLRVSFTVLRRYFTFFVLREVAPFPRSGHICIL